MCSYWDTESSVFLLDPLQQPEQRFEGAHALSSRTLPSVVCQIRSTIIQFLAKAVKIYINLTFPGSFPKGSATRMN
jgi:hypothetical protein